MSIPGGEPPQMPGRQSSLPISRSTGASYERPERARTSHACEPCRERKTKCDGERPSCRRCLHTGTNCHYGYGKGWRKRKTAEDLSATSRRLARYEALLNDIIPHVPPNVKAMIEEAREQEATSVSGGSEGTDNNDTPRTLPSMGSDMSSSSRVSLPLPLPNLGAQAPLAHSPSLTRPFEQGPHGSLNSSMPRPSSRASQEEHSSARLPSITAHGLLIEPSLAAQTGQLPQATSEPSLYRDLSMGHDQSPTNRSYPEKVSP